MFHEQTYPPRDTHQELIWCDTRWRGAFWWSCLHSVPPASAQSLMLGRRNPHKGFPTKGFVTKTTMLTINSCDSPLSVASMLWQKWHLAPVQWETIRLRHIWSCIYVRIFFILDHGVQENVISLYVESAHIPLAKVTSRNIQGSRYDLWILSSIFLIISQKIRNMLQELRLCTNCSGS